MTGSLLEQGNDEARRKATYCSWSTPTSTCTSGRPGAAPSTTPVRLADDAVPGVGQLDEDIAGAAATAALGWLARTGCTTSMDHHYVFPRAGGDVLGATVEAARAVGLRFHPTRGSMDLGSATAGCRLTTWWRTSTPSWPRRGRRSTAPRPRPRLDAADRGGPVLAVLGHRRAAAAGRRAGPATGRAAAHPPGGDRRRGRVLPGALRLHPGGVRGFARLAGRGRLARRTGSTSTTPAIATLAATGTGVAHCPSSNARLGAGIAGRATCATPGCRSASAWTARPPMRRARCWRRSGTPCCSPAPAAARWPCPSATRWSWAPSAVPGCSAGTTEIGSLEPGKLADIALWRLDTLRARRHRRPGRGTGARAARPAGAAAGQRPPGRRAGPPGHRRRAANSPGPRSPRTGLLARAGVGSGQERVHS